MAIPSARACAPVLLRILADNGEGLTSKLAQDLVADDLDLADEDRNAKLPSGSGNAFRNRVRWAHVELKKAGLAASPARGVWAATDDGKTLAAGDRATLDARLREALSRRRPTDTAS